VILHCSQYGVGCYYCEWLVLIYGRKARGGLLQSGSFSEQVMVDSSAENARLQVIVSDQTKKHEDIAETFLAVTARPVSSHGDHLPDEMRKASLLFDFN
ncbi:hypothetical protein LINGRAHAP2_LOCUS3956, partial [Linum grandiflorum]